jgi:hypothetical protein
VGRLETVGVSVSRHVSTIGSERNVRRVAEASFALIASECYFPAVFTPPVGCVDAGWECHANASDDID